MNLVAVIIIMFIVTFNIVVIIIIIIRRRIFIASRGKASKEEQGHKGYNNDSEGIHLMGLEKTGHWYRYRLGD